MLAAKFDSLAKVVAGTTLGMLIVDVPIVLFGRVVSSRIPMRAVRVAAAAVFAALGAWVLLA